MSSYLLTGILISKKSVFRKLQFVIILFSFIGSFTIIYTITNPITFKYTNCLICVFILLQMMVLLNIDKLFGSKKV